MKLSPVTTKILNNFSNINSGIVIKEGNIQHTICPLSTIIAETTLPDVFEKTFAIYDIAGFLKILKTFNEPDLEFSDAPYIKIVEGKKSSKFFFSDASLITVPKKTPYAHDDVSVQFSVPLAVLDNIKSVSSISSYFKVLKIWSTPDNNITMSLTSKDEKDRATNSYDIIVGSTVNQKLQSFCFYLQLEILKILDGDYDFVISELPGKETSIFVIRMTNNTYPVTYWTSLDRG